MDHDVAELEGRRLLIAGLHHHTRRYREGLKDRLAHLARLAEGYSRSVLVLHQSVDRFLPFEYELSFDELPSTFNYVALGHVHRRGSAWLHRTLVAYSGSLEIARRDEVKAWREVGKGFYLVDLSGDEPSLHKVDLDTVRPQIEATVKYGELRQGLAQLIEEAKACRKPPIIHLRVEGSRIDRRRVYEEAQAALAPYALTWRPEFVEEERPTGHDVKRSLDLKQLLEEALGSLELAQLAYELFKLLREPGRVEDAKRLVEDYYRQWSPKSSTLSQPT